MILKGSQMAARSGRKGNQGWGYTSPGRLGPGWWAERKPKHHRTAKAVGAAGASEGSLASKGGAGQAPSARWAVWMRGYGRLGSWGRGHGGPSGRNKSAEKGGQGRAPSTLRQHVAVHLRQVGEGRDGVMGCVCEPAAAQLCCGP